MRVLKLDVDLKPDKIWRDAWKETRLNMLEDLGYNVEKLYEFETTHGYHYYIYLKEQIEPEEANRLQFLLGDDHTRVKINAWRIERGIKHWNKLFHRTLWRKKRKIVTCRYCGAKIPID